MSKPPAPPQDLKGIVLSAEEKARQRRRSRAIAIAVAGLVVLCAAKGMAKGSIGC